MKKIVIAVCVLFSFITLCAFSTASKDKVFPINLNSIPSVMTNNINKAVNGEGSIPSGCYEGTSRRDKGFCKIMISYGTLHVCNRQGTVIARWKIEGDKDGVLTLKSEYGVGGTASWWTEDRNIYLNFSYNTYVRMSD